eukprot:GHUV01030071.1.p1 GENE.GHUV01030071.1~~GHUV01030071.1.p1  ORF type:complete len:312 (-),score=101.70 GHUV01030071.1:509-1444(-)
MLHGHKPFNQLLHIGRGLLALCASVTQAIVLLLPQGAYPSSQWVPPAHLAGNRTADTATFYDTNSQQMLLQRPALTTSVLGANLTGFGIPRPAAAGFSGLTSSAASNSAPLLGNARKPRLNNSISLNKQIMNTHSMRELHNIVRSKGAGFDFFNISSAIARVPKLVGPTGGVQNDVTAKALVDDLASLMATQINTFDARGLANSAWAFGKLKYSPNQKLPALIAAAAIDKMEAFSAQNLSNLLWSFVYLHYRNEQLLTAVAKQVSCTSRCASGCASKPALSLRAVDLPGIAARGGISHLQRLCSLACQYDC